MCEMQTNLRGQCSRRVTGRGDKTGVGRRRVSVVVSVTVILSKWKERNDFSKNKKCRHQEILVSSRNVYWIGPGTSLFD